MRQIGAIGAIGALGALGAIGALGALGAAGAPGAVVDTFVTSGLERAAAAIVATRARSGVTSPLPSGCRRLERKMTYAFEEGSIQSEVPVKPV